MTRRQVVSSDGVALHVLDVGSGTPVLLLHGWGLSGEVWDRQVGVLAQAGHRVLALDTRGHGRSDRPLGPYDLDRLALDAVDVLDDAGLDSAAVVGWSLGGMTAVRLAAVAPTRVTRLVVVASSGVAASRTEHYPFGYPADRVLPAWQAAERADRVSHRRALVAGLFASPPAPDVLDWLHRICLQTPSWSGQACMDTLMRTEQVGALEALRVPVTQIVGDADPFLALDAARWVQERLGSALVELPCGHFPMLEAADAFDTALLAALEPVPGPVS